MVFHLIATELLISRYFDFPGFTLSTDNDGRMNRGRSSNYINNSISRKFSSFDAV